MTRSAILVEANCPLLSSFVLRFNIFCGASICPILPPPNECCLDALDGIVDIPLGCTKVSLEALFGKPHLLVILQLGLRRIFLGGDRDGIDFFKVLENFGVLFLLLFSELRNWNRLAVGSGMLEYGVLLPSLLFL